MKKRSQLISNLPNKKDPDNDETAIDFKWSDVQEEVEEDIASANFIESLQKQADYENKKLNNCFMIAVLYLIKWKIKIFFG